MHERSVRAYLNVLADLMIPSATAGAVFRLFTVIYGYLRLFMDSRARTPQRGSSNLPEQQNLHERLFVQVLAVLADLMIPSAVSVHGSELFTVIYGYLRSFMVKTREAIAEGIIKSARTSITCTNGPFVQVMPFLQI